MTLAEIFDMLPQTERALRVKRDDYPFAITNDWQVDAPHHWRVAMNGKTLGLVFYRGGRKAVYWDRAATTPGKWATFWDLVHDREIRANKGKVICTFDPGWTPTMEKQARQDADFIVLAKNYEVEGEVRVMADAIRRLWGRLGMEGGIP